MSELHNTNELSRSDKEWVNKSVGAYESVNGTYKQQEKTSENGRKHSAIAELKQCHYRTPPKKVALLLTELFSKNPSHNGHWLYIAQRYTPKTVNSVIYQMIKSHSRGDEKIINPSAYFTKIITKYRKARKKFRTTNGT